MGKIRVDTSVLETQAAKLGQIASRLENVSQNLKQTANGISRDISSSGQLRSKVTASSEIINSIGSKQREAVNRLKEIASSYKKTEEATGGKEITAKEKAKRYKKGGGGYASAGGGANAFGGGKKGVGFPGLLKPNATNKELIEYLERYYGALPEDTRVIIEEMTPKNLRYAASIAGDIVKGEFDLESIKTFMDAINNKNDPYSNAFNKVFHMGADLLQGKGTIAEIVSASDAIKRQAYDAFDRGDYIEGIKYFAQSTAVAFTAIPYGVLDASTEMMADAYDAVTKPVELAGKAVDAMIPSNISSSIVDGTNSLLGSIDKFFPNEFCRVENLSDIIGTPSTILRGLL